MININLEKFSHHKISPLQSFVAIVAIHISLIFVGVFLGSLFNVKEPVPFKKQSQTSVELTQSANLNHNLRQSASSLSNEKNKIERISMEIPLGLIIIYLIFSFFGLYPFLKKIFTYRDQLIEQANFFKKIEMSGQIGGWELTVETGKITWSDGVYNIHKLPVGSPTDRVDAINYYEPHERKRISNLVDRGISHKEKYDSEFQFVDEEKNKKWVRAIGEPVVDASGKVVKLVGVFQDITSRKVAETNQQEARRYLELAVDGAGLGIWDWNLENNSVRFDKKWAEMIGLNIDDIEMKLETWQKLVHPDDLAGAYSDIENYIEGKTPFYENIHRMKHANGSWVYILDRGRFSAWNKEGKPTRFTGTHFDITSSRRLQEEQKFIISSAKMGTWKFDVENNILEWDDSMYDLYEIDKKDFSGAFDAWEGSLDDDYRADAVHTFQETLNENKKFETVFAIRNKKGERRYISARAKTECNHEGKVTKVYGINWDVTDEYLSKQELKTYVDGLNRCALVLKTTSKGLVKQVNQKYTEVVGTSPNDLINHPNPLLSIDLQDKSTIEEINKNMKEGLQWQGELKILHKDGHTLWIDTTVTPTFNNLNAIDGYSFFMYEITKLKQTETELTKSLRLQKLSSSILDISDTDFSFNIKLNRVLELFTNEKWLSFNSRSMLKIYTSPDIGEMTENTNLSLEESEKFKEWFDEHETQFRESFKPKNLKTLAFLNEHPESSYQPLVLPIVIEKSVVGVICLLSEEKEPRVLKNQLDSLEYLEPSISELIRRGINKIRYHKQKKIAHHNSRLASIGELAAGVGHEINNPLAIVKGFSEILAQKVENDQYEEDAFLNLLRKMNVACDRIENIVKGLRTFSRSDSEDGEVFSISDVIGDSLSLVQEIYQHEEIEILWDNQLKSQNVQIEGNRGRIEQVLMNLIANAKDATENQSHRKITISTYLKHKNVVINVSDNGPGIPSHLKEKIFDAFFTTKEVNKGTGIGLSLVHSIVNEHQGQIYLEEQQKKGASFTVKLPTLELASIQRIDKAPSPNFFKKSLSLKILLVDDEELIRELLNDILSGMGAEVTTCSNGREALNEIESNPNHYNCLITDRQMPIMGGIELVESLKKNNLMENLDIFIITGGVANDIESENKNLSSMIKGYFFKPFDTTQIFQALQDLQPSNQPLAS